MSISKKRLVNKFELFEQPKILIVSCGWLLIQLPHANYNLGHRYNVVNL
jgi:hypothetical protein